ncbi:hypothetical protein ACHWQZ_G001714 [Mnemiopsis leidyi]
MRKEANISISKHPQLLEILELPQLIDTSIRNNYFEEGLELHSFVNNLAVKYSDIQIIQMIKEDSDACIRHMEEILIKQLQGQITLAQCLKSVGLLRRIGSYTDTELKVKFLLVRTEWFRGIIDNIKKDEIQYFMCKMIDSYRVNLFDIITQYRSVFIEDKATSLIFNSWLHKQVEYFLTLLNENLPRCSGAILDSTLAQAMYFGMSLGRVGTDFRGALVPIFQRRILELCLKTIRRATVKFRKNYETLLEVAYHGEPTLVNLAPLAVYTNSIASMFNELRHCAPVSIWLNVVQALQTSLHTVINLTVEILRPKIAEKFSSIIVLEMLPMIDSYLKSVFKTLPDLYKQRAFSGNSSLNPNTLSLNLPELHEPLLPFLSAATKILLTDAPFSVENEVVEDVGRSETTAENGGETETTATNESETGIENVMEQGETKNETAYHENTNETDSHEKLAGEKVQIHDSRGEREPQNLNSENEESKTEDKESETDPPKRLEDNQVVDNEEYSELSKTDNPDDYHENDNPVVNINSGTDEKLDSSGFEENNVQPKSEDKELQAADKDQIKEISDSAELEKMPR